MKRRLSDRTGNVLLVTLILAFLGFGVLALFFVNNNDYVKLMTDSGVEASSNDLDKKILGLVLKKVSLSGKQKSDWFTEFYPTASEMNADSNLDLAHSNLSIKSMSSAAIPDETFVRLFWVRGKLDENDQCKPISPFVYKKTKESGDCDVVTYVADGSGLGAVKSETQDSGVSFSEAASTLIGVPNLALLTIQDRLKLFSPGAKLPLKNIVESLPVTFKKRIADPSNPNKLSKFLVSVNKGGRETLGLIPVSAPATPACQASVVSSQPVSLKNGDQTVNFQVQSDSLTTAVRIILPDGSEPLLPDGSQQPFLQSSLDRYRMSNYGEMNDLKKTVGFDLRILQSKVPDMIGKTGVVVDPNNQYRQYWTITARVAGIDGTTSDCYVPLSVDIPLPPNCVFTADTLNPSPGQTVGLNLNCDTPTGGPVTSAEISTVTSDPSNDNRFKVAKQVSKVVQKYNDVLKKNEDVVVTEIIQDPDLSKVSQKVFKKNYTKAAARTIERLTVKVTGPGGVFTDTLSLDGGCPYSDITFQRKEFGPSDWFQDVINENDKIIEHPIGDLIFTRSQYNYGSNGKFFYSDDAKNLGVIYQGWVKKEDGSWIGAYQANATTYGANVELGETCDATNYCMAMIQVNKLESAKTDCVPGGKIYWVEVGPKTTASCSVIRTKMRHGGCFSGDTKIRMADGKEKKVSQIGEDEYLYNPFYQAPVRVKKVVKGPEKKALWEVKYGENKVVVTEDHPFLTQQGWVQTQSLKAGEVLIGDGKSEKVTSVKKLKYQAPEDVWNFELDTDDTYGHMVLANGVPTGDLTTQLNLKNEIKKVH